MSFVGESLTSASQLVFVLQSPHSAGDFLFPIISISQPLLYTCFDENVWSKVLLAIVNNRDHRRMEALSELTGEGYREEIIAGNLGDHILAEYKVSQENLGDTCTDDFWDQVQRGNTPIFDIFCALARDLPLAYCAIKAIKSPSKYSIASVAVLQQSSTALRNSFNSILNNVATFQRHVNILKELYSVFDRKIEFCDGDISYPGEESRPTGRGMGLELQNVTFSYPGSKTKTALNNVSLSIKPGQLVVIVGANGSGKSTMVKLMTRLYEPSSGTLLIDNVAAERYRSSSLRRAMATLTQDHKIYPLSIYENISLITADDPALVTKAAKQGGALKFIERLTDGMDTILEPRSRTFNVNIPSDPAHPLQKQIDSLPKKIDISGGEKQRLVAARIFMRFNMEEVNFVAVDEPSSALDAEGESQLFNQLIAERSGKTMVFVTHRFGHLTQHADMIVCMKDGALVECGSHKDLLKLDGEYAKLYNIQAGAFAVNEFSE
ncbi:hypothetical protein H0H81_007084 [Sphagnurus paluster]|uniref:ABC transporter domain-containing protein n=1 Tax=Sphagnurus paluster TaxID=117069 RepID=A0A9P7FXM5_9AGAR|nr:hypothetical protein H0H81_007084 [Sphagnurus paluster]